MAISELVPECNYTQSVEGVRTRLEARVDTGAAADMYRDAGSYFTRAAYRYAGELSTLSAGAAFDIIAEHACYEAEDPALLDLALPYVELVRRLQILTDLGMALALQPESSPEIQECWRRHWGQRYDFDTTRYDQNTLLSYQLNLINAELADAFMTITATQRVAEAAGDHAAKASLTTQKIALFDQAQRDFKAKAREADGTFDPARIDEVREIQENIASLCGVFPENPYQPQVVSACRAAYGCLEQSVRIELEHAATDSSLTPDERLNARVTLAMAGAPLSRVNIRDPKLRMADLDLRVAHICRVVEPELWHEIVPQIKRPELASPDIASDFLQPGDPNASRVLAGAYRTACTTGDERTALWLSLYLGQLYERGIVAPPDETAEIKKFSTQAENIARYLGKRAIRGSTAQVSAALFGQVSALLRAHDQLVDYTPHAIKGLLDITEALECALPHRQFKLRNVLPRLQSAIEEDWRVIQQRASCQQTEANLRPRIDRLQRFVSQQTAGADR